MNPIFAHPDDVTFGSPPREDAVALAESCNCTLLDMGRAIVRASYVRGVAHKLAWADVDDVMRWAVKNAKLVKQWVPTS